MRIRWLLPGLLSVLSACAEQRTERATGTTSAPAPPPPSASASAPARKSVLGIYARSRTPLHAYTLGDEVFVSSRSALYRLQDAKLSQEVALGRGLDAAADAVALAGRFPEATLIETRTITELEPRFGVLHWLAAESRWEKLEAIAADEALLGAATVRGATLALVGSERGMRLLSPSQSKKPVLALQPASGECTTELRGPVANPAREGALGALAAFESGHVFVAGTRCDAEHSWAVARFAPGAAASVIDPLPRVGGTERPRFRLIGRSAERLFLLVEGEGVLLSFDGRTWKRELLTVSGRVKSAALSKQGSLWLVIAGGLWRRAPAGELERFALPDASGAPLIAIEVAAASDERVLVVARDGSGAHNVLLRGHAGQRVIELPSALGDSKLARRPASELCDRPFVLISQGASQNPKRLKAVSSRLAFLEEIELVTEPAGGGQDLGLVTKSWDVAKRAVALLEGAPDVRPALYCHEPRIGRRIPIEKPEED